jgi:crotonobetainyl-CoA:carnitine CoA-transferase CaiB-like acyl-CoA transferase
MGKDANNTDAGLDRPLTGVRVIDLAYGPLAAISRYLVELGAEVIRVEPPGGAQDRREGVCVQGQALGFVANNLGKRAVALNLSDANDREHLGRLAETADLLIEASAPGSVEAEWINVPALRKRNPMLVVLSVTPFGQTGAYAHWKVTDPVLQALGGVLSRSGLAGRSPLLPPGTLALDCALAQAAYVLLLAYINRLKTGQGDHLDLSLLDAAVQALDPGYGIAGSAAAGVPASQLPRGRERSGFRYPIIPCADGYTRICVLAPRQWQGMFEWMGRPEEFADPSFNKLHARFKSKTLIPAIGRLFADKTRAELEEAGQRYGVPTAALLSPQEALETAQMKARKAFVAVDVAPSGGVPVSAPFPDGFMEIDGIRAGIRGPAPALEPAATVKFSNDERPRGASAAGVAPLSGLRVLDLGVIVVGAEQTRLLGDQGAEVIKVENAGFPDGSRQTFDGSPMSASFAAGHRNKKGLGLNLRHPEGKALFLRLIENTDVVCSNFKPGTMESLGLGYDVLSQINPRIIVVDSSAFGPTGPWSKRLGYGPLVRASTGLTAEWRYPDDPASFSDAITVYPDHVAGRIGVIGVLALLIRRERTGRGGTISISQAEVMMNHMATRIASDHLRAKGQVLQGDRPSDAPWGVYACAGDDEWCAIGVTSDTEWKALCEVIGDAALSEDASLSSATGRAAARERIDTCVSAWTSTRSPDDVMTRLQSAGVPAGAMLRVVEQPQHPYYRERGFFREVTHPHIANPFFVESLPVQSAHLAEPANGPAPLIGEHTVMIAREQLGLSEDEVERLVAAQVLELR